jgi:putative FmdB family regulatory protein
MPYYDYLCDTCGPFTLVRPMAEAGAPQPCPECASTASRAFLRAPAMTSMNGARRRAHETNEKSRAAPVLASTLGRPHGPGCGCCRPTAKPASGSEMKTFPGKRPWMIAH